MAKKKHFSHPHSDGKMRRVGYARQLMMQDAENDIMDSAGIMALVLHEHYGFGLQRVKRLIVESRATALTKKDNAAIRAEIEQKTGWACPPMEHNRQLDKRDLSYKSDCYAVATVGLLAPTMYLMLHELFGFGKKRLEQTLARNNAKHASLWDENKDIRIKEDYIYTEFSMIFGVTLQSIWAEEIDEDAVMNASLEID